MAPGLPNTATPVTLSWFDAEDAPGSRDLETCIHCGLCLTACPTYRELKIEPDSPRGRIYLMRGLAEGRVAADSDLVGHLDQCLGCRACETVCPAGVPYGRMLEETRGQFARRAAPRSAAGRLGRFVLEHVIPHRARMHAAADLLRLGQRGPVARLLASRVARRLLPRFAVQGMAMTPALEPRESRAIERVARELPPGARMESTPAGTVFAPAGTPRARVAWFASCVMETMFPALERDAVRLLVLAGCEVTVPRAQTCCGALHAHSGLRRAAKALAARNVAAFAAPARVAAYDFIATDSAGCGAALRDYGHLLATGHAGDPDGVRDASDGPTAAAAAAFGARVRDVSEVLAAVGLPPATATLHAPDDRGRPLRVGYHDPCHLAHAQKVRAEPRALLRAIPGVQLVDLPNSDWCCGSAGVYNLTHAEMADRQLDHKLQSIARVAPDVVVASNPGCMLHMARGARERGPAVPIVHLVELLARAYPPAPASERG